MKRTPCEHLLWHGLPVIRKEIAETMIKKFGLTQRQTAKKIGVTPAAICQYLKHKRGNNDNLNDEFREEIRISARRILHDNGEITIETCRLCRIFRTRENHGKKDSLKKE
jgi:predicted transcriptional regulator